MSKCCICGQEIMYGWMENNPWPVCKIPGAVCCAGCNESHVISARIRQMVTSEEGNDLKLFTGE